MALCDSPQFLANAIIPAYTIHPSGAFDSSRPRVVYGRFGITIHAYPSHGGNLELYDPPLPILDFLGLSPALEIYNTSGPTPSDEDAFALRMLQIGAQWWPSEQFLDRHLGYDSQFPYFYKLPPRRDIGYPSSGGVLVLTTSFHDRSSITIPGDHPPRPKEFSRLFVTRSMSEYCGVLEKFNATFYEDVQDCPDVPKTLEEGIRMAKGYVEEMAKMELTQARAAWYDEVLPFLIEVEDEDEGVGEGFQDCLGEW